MRAAFLAALLALALAAAACGDGDVAPSPPTRGAGQPVVSAGGAHTCALRNGDLFCWGSNASGQLGFPAQDQCAGAPCALRPGRVQTTLRFSAISAGLNHTCALDDAGRAVCWGDNQLGQLGDGTTTARATPTPVATDLRFAGISAGWDHTCAWTADGSASCWGTNRYGQLGSDAASERCTDVVQATGQCSTRPLPVAGGHTFAEVTAGRLHTCARAEDNAVFCWGHNEAGQVGVALLPETCDAAPCARTPVAVSGGLRATAIDAGADHTCAVAGDGDAWCWGLNSWGKVAPGNAISYAEPQKIAGNATWVAITAGDEDSCGIVAGGAARCWGFGFGGQRGDGTKDATVSSPAPVVGGLRFASISAGGSHACGVTTGARIFCWGTNDHGQLGADPWNEQCAIDRGGQLIPCSLAPRTVTLP